MRGAWMVARPSPALQVWGSAGDCCDASASFCVRGTPNLISVLAGVDADEIANPPANMMHAPIIDIIMIGLRPRGRATLAHLVRIRIWTETPLIAIGAFRTSLITNSQEIER